MTTEFILKGRSGDYEEQIHVARSLEALTDELSDDFNEFKITWRNGYTERTLFGWADFDDLVDVVSAKTGQDFIVVD